LTQRAFCPKCRHENPQDNRFCGSCGTSLTTGSGLVPSRERSVIAGRRAWPTKQTPAGKALAVSLMALAAAVGSSLLRQRVGRVGRLRTSAARVAAPPTPELLVGESLEEVFVWLQRGDLSGSELRTAGRRYIRRLGVNR
jgi:zinc ribbon protein